MAKVYMFPTEKKLPGGMEKRLKEVAKEYVETLYATMTLFGLEGEPPSTEEVQKLVEVAFAEGIIEAIDDLI